MSHKATDSGASPFETVSRRGFLATAAVGTAAGASGLVYAQQQDYAYKLGGKIAGWQGIAPASIANAVNPTLSFQVGQEYTVWWKNLDGAPHNFVIVDANGNSLVSTEIIREQGQPQTVTFTATTEMTEYHCSVHPNTMQGEVNIETGGDGTPTQTPTQTPTVSPTTSAAPTDGPTTTVPSSPPATTTTAPSTETMTGTRMTQTTTEQTTATDGPGFGVLAALGGIGLYGWRSLIRE